MKLATTTNDFARFGTFIDCVRWIHDAGFRYLDFGVSNREFLRDAGWRFEAEKLNDYAKSLGMTFIQMHSPECAPIDPLKREDAIAVTIRSIEIAAFMGIPQTVVHPGTRKGITKEEFFRENRAFYHALLPTMEKTGVNVLVENTSKVNAPPEVYYDLYTGEEIAEFLRYMDHPLLHAVWDTGHANTDGGQYEHLKALGKDLYGLHIHDNSGRADEHSYPYTGTLSLDELMHGLIDVGYQGYFTFEAFNLLHSKNGQKKRAFEQDERLRHAPLELHFTAEKLLYEIGRHCLTAYGVFEE